MSREMMFPSVRNESEVPEQIDSEYLLGRFDPRDAQRIRKRLEAEHVLFTIDDCGDVRSDNARYSRRNLVCIYICREHQEKAEAIVLEDVQP